MEKQHRNIRILIEDNYEDASTAAGDLIAEQVKKKPDSVLGFATGSTPIGAYERLIALYKSGQLDFSNITTFNLDEYYPIERSHVQSYHHFMHETLFQHINIDPRNTHVPSGEATNADAECVRYENAIDAAAGIDLQLLGIGLNGHIGFNEPNTIFPKATHCVDLDASTIKANSRFFPSAADVPRQALTMGIGTIFQAEQILLLITGASKAEITEKVIFGEIDPQVAGSSLQLHPNVTVILDAAAGERVKDRL